MWRMNYTFGRNAQGKSSQKTLAIGGYPVVTLLEARAARDESKALLRDGRDPSAVKQEKASAKDERATQTFESVAILWFELKSGWSVELSRSWRAAHDG
ncbi:Arm DNA-binding domain-containing protein [Sphingopyxis sp. FBM22]|nr:Arm DNA-binding domain-containing protein [Sphingopyxis yananensis]